MYVNVVYDIHVDTTFMTHPCPVSSGRFNSLTITFFFPVKKRLDLVAWN